MCSLSELPTTHFHTQLTNGKQGLCPRTQPRHDSVTRKAARPNGTGNRISRPVERIPLQRAGVAETYLVPALPQEISGKDLYGARCGVLRGTDSRPRPKANSAWFVIKIRRKPRPFSLSKGWHLHSSPLSTISSRTRLETIHERHCSLSGGQDQGPNHRAWALSSASKGTGIKTAVKVTGHYRQTGSYMEITFISDNVPRLRSPLRSPGPSAATARRESGGYPAWPMPYTAAIACWWPFTLNDRTIRKMPMIRA